MSRKYLKKISKKQSLYFHFNKSCIKRVGRILDQKVIIKQISNNKLEFIDRQSNSVTRWKYIVDNNEYIICYDTFRGQLITIFPYNNNTEDDNKYPYYWLLKDNQ